MSDADHGGGAYRRRLRGDGDRLVVDFDKAVPVAYPGGQPSRPPPLRVAVAAMISPKETFDQYRRLLEYLSRRAGKELEFIQRKTCAENLSETEPITGREVG